MNPHHAFTKRLIGWLPPTLLVTAAVACGAPVPGPEPDQDVCGNGIIEGVEQCDDGNSSDADGCLTSCQYASCGDGAVYAGVEQCDDGNFIDGDGCSSSCAIGGLCGDGVLDQGEACDDGNRANNDGCLDTCVPASCGDGYAQLGVEQCDDGNLDDSDGCDTSCQLAASEVGTCPGIELDITTASATNVVGSTAATGDSLSASCGGAGAADAIYAVVPKSSGWLTITLTGLSGTDPLLAVRGGSCEQGQELACADDSGTGGAEVATLQVTGGQTYWVIVDAAGSEAVSYSLNLALGTEVPGDSCPGSPVALDSGSPVTIEGDTATATSGYKGEGQCAGAASTKELVYAVTPSQSGQLTATLQAPGFDGVLYARVGSCTNGMQVACSDGWYSGSETISFSAVAGTKYSIFADGAGGDAGAFTLTVAIEP